MKHPFQKSITLLLLGALLLTFSGCWSGDLLDDDPAQQEDLGMNSKDGAAETPEDHIAPITAFALPYLPDETLDPLTCGDGMQQVFLPLLYEGLFVLDETFTPWPQLCSSYNYSADYTQWTLHLRGGVTFSDGTPLTAQDAAASLLRAKASARYGPRLAAVTSITASENAVFLTLNEGNNRLPALLDIPITAEHTAGSMVPAGTGPYVFTENDSGAALQKNGTWWQQKPLPVDTLPLVAAEDEAALSYLFSAHEIQLTVSDLTGSSAIHYKGSTTVTDAPTTTMLYLGYNCARGPFSNSALRAALAQGVNRTSLVRAYYSSHAAASAFPVSPFSPWYPQELETDYSAEAFQQAMTAAGYNRGETHTVSMLVCDGSSFRLSAAKALAAALSECDIKITLKILPYSEYCAALRRGDFDLYYGEVQMTPDFNCAPLLKTGGALNYGSYSEPAMDALLSTAFTSANAPQSANTSLLTMVQQEAPIVPLCFKARSVIVQGGAAEHLTPTAANVFYQFTDWQIHIKGEPSNG